MNHLAAICLAALVSIPSVATRAGEGRATTGVYFKLLTSNGQKFGEPLPAASIERLEDKAGVVHQYVIVYGDRDVDATKFSTKEFDSFLVDADGDGFDDLVVEVDDGEYAGIVFVGGWGSSMYQYDFPGDYGN